jgi:hypothetical protein
VAATSAQASYNAEQGRKALEALAPSSPCEEEGTCGPQDPGELYKVGCNVWATIHFRFVVIGLHGNEVYALGYFHCSKPQAHFGLQVCVQDETAVEIPGDGGGWTFGHKYENYGGEEACTKEDPETGTHGKTEASVGCEDPAQTENYRAWVWGRSWGSWGSVDGWNVSVVRWSGVVCEHTAHAPGTEP